MYSNASRGIAPAGVLEQIGEVHEGRDVRSRLWARTRGDSEIGRVCLGGAARLLSMMWPDEPPRFEEAFVWM